MTAVDLYAHIADRLTLVVGAPYSEKDLTIEQLENCADSLTVFFAGVLERERKEQANGSGTKG